MGSDGGLFRIHTSARAGVTAVSLGGRARGAARDDEHGKDAKQDSYFHRQGGIVPAPMMRLRVRP